MLQISVMVWTLSVGLEAFIQGEVRSHPAITISLLLTLILSKGGGLKHQKAIQSFKTHKDKHPQAIYSS